MSRPRPQKAKRRARPRHWHSGQSESRRWDVVDLPDVGSGADPTSGAPKPNRAVPRGKRRHGDAL